MKAKINTNFERIARESNCSLTEAKDRLWNVIADMYSDYEMDEIFFSESDFGVGVDCFAF